MQTMLQSAIMNTKIIKEDHMSLKDRDRCDAYICRNMIIRELMRRSDSHAKNSGIHRTYPSQFRHEELGDFHRNIDSTGVWVTFQLKLIVDANAEDTCSDAMQTSCAAFAESLCAPNVFDVITQKSTIIWKMTNAYKLL